MRDVYDLKRDRDGVDARVGRVAASQHGVISRAQVIQLEVTAGEIRGRLRSRKWELAGPKIYRLAGTPMTWNQRAMAAVLHWGPDAVISHRAAAKLRALCGLRHARVEVTVQRGRNRSALPGVVVHRRSTAIPAGDVATVDGLPVTKPARTLLDLAAIESERVTARFLDDALRRRLISLSFLDRWLSDPAIRRHRGITALRRLIGERATHGVTDSELETDALTLIRNARLPIPMLQYRVVDDRGRVVGRLDLAYPEKRVGIELDSFRFHDTRDGFDAERARGNELQAMGWKILRVTSKHLEQNPDEVIAWIRRAIGA